VVFNDAVRELSAHRLFWTHYQTNTSPGVDRYGLHATELGWRASYTSDIQITLVGDLDQGVTASPVDAP